MCISSRASISVFIFGILSCFILLKYGNKDLENHNKVIAYSISFVLLMQLVDFFIWNDLDCKLNLNKMMGIIGPILNYLQPLIFFILAIKYLNVSDNKHYEIVKGINIAYLIIFLVLYANYLNNREFCSSLNPNNNISWLWSKKLNIISNIHVIVLAINLFFIFKKNFALLCFITGYSLLAISIKYFPKSVGELWCFLTGVFVILLIFLTQKLFPKLFKTEK